MATQTPSRKRLVPIELHVSGDNRIQLAYVAEARATALFLRGEITIRELPSGDVVYSARACGSLRCEAGAR